MADLPNPANNALATQDEGKDAVFANILETLQSNNSLLFQIDENTEGDETATEKRNRRIKDENTDPTEKGSGIFSKMGSGLKATGGALQKINPFSGGIGTKMGILLLVGALTLLMKFGDKLVKPLADLLEWFDKEGGILDKLKETKLWQGIIDVFEKIQTRAKEIAKDMALLLESFTKVKDIIVGAYNEVNEYIMSFDTDMEGEEGFGELDAEERKALYGDLKDKVVDTIGKFVSQLWDAVTVTLIGTVFLGAAVKSLLGSAAITSIFGYGKKPSGGKLVGRNAKGQFTKLKPGVGVGGMFAIAALIAFGVSETFANFQESMEKTLKENNGNMDWSDFIGNFMGGDAEGGAMNAFAQAKKIGGTGALAGMAIGTALLPGVGTVIGGLVGLLAGGILGAATGYAGSDKMKTMTDNLATGITSTADAIYLFFNGLVEGVKSTFEGRGFMQGFNETMAENATHNEKKLAEGREELAAAENLPNEYAREAARTAAKEKIAKYEVLVREAPQQQANNMRQELTTEIESKTDALTTVQKTISEGNELQGWDWFQKTFPSLSKGKSFTDMESTLKSEIARLNNEKRQLLPYRMTTLDIKNRDEIAQRNELLAGYANDIGIPPSTPSGPVVTYQDILNSRNIQVDQHAGSELGVSHTDEVTDAVKRIIKPGGFSDIRLKEDIKLVGKSPSGIDIYEFKYKGEDDVYQGVMAQEVPWAASVAENGYLFVDYSKLDVEFKCLTH